jgi:hypothetical protein
MVDRKAPTLLDPTPVPRLKILSGSEQTLFDRPPELSAAERRRAFELPVAFWSAANRIG